MDAPAAAHAPLQRMTLAMLDSLHERPMWASLLSAACTELRASAATLWIEAPTAEHPPMIFTAGTGLDAPTCAAWLAARDSARPLNWLAQAGGTIMGLSITRPDARQSHLLVRLAAHDDAAAQLLANFAPVLDRAMRLFLDMVATQRSLRVGDSVLEASRLAVLAVRGDGMILHANARARMLLGAQDGLLDQHGRLRCTRPAESERLLATIADMAQRQCAASDAPVYDLLSVARDGDDVPLTVIVRPGPDFGPATSPLQRSAIVVARDPAWAPLLPPQTLLALFSLSKAEAALASELVRGASLEDAAADLAISRNTAKSQLQAIFQKTGTKRQSDLIRLVLNSAALLASR